jgi:hypothetical protein
MTRSSLTGWEWLSKLNIYVWLCGESRNRAVLSEPQSSEVPFAVGPKLGLNSSLYFRTDKTNIAHPSAPQ